MKSKVRDNECASLNRKDGGRILKQRYRFLCFAAVMLLSVVFAQAQTTAFSYQGRLTESGNPANGAFQMQFKLFDSLAGGTQIGSTLADVPVTVSQGIFSVRLDFGAIALSGANRWLEIAVRHNSGESYTTLAPREQIASSPYAVRTLSAATADNALNLGGIAASEYLTNTNPGNSVIRNQTTLQASSNFNISGNGLVGGRIGIGTTTPASALELRGTSFGAQQRITDSTSGNSLVLQGGPGSSMKITGFNYTTGIAQPLYLSTDGANTLINSGGGTLGVGTATPDSAYRIDSFGNVRAFSTSDANFSVQTSGTNNVARYYMRSANRNWYIGTTQSFNNDQFYIGEFLAGTRMVINTNGAMGFGTVNPDPNFRADFLGPVRSFGDSTNFVAQTTGGTNSWARYYMRSPSQSWFIGTSQNFNGNQFYISDETFNQSRFTIQPNGGPIYMQGNATSDLGGYGLPKALIHVNGDGTIIRCYNGVTGASTAGCGFTVSRNVPGSYFVEFGFDVSSRFVLVSLRDGTINNPVGITYQSINSSISVSIFETHQSGIDFDRTDRPFTVAVF